MKPYLIRIGDALSQMINVVLFNGHPNESISGRAWRTQSVWYKLIDFVLWFDKDHCLNSYLNDLRYAHQLAAGELSNNQ